MLTIFQYDFMVRAFIAAIIIGSLAPVVGIFLVVRRYSLLADTLSHVSLVGVALASLFNVNPVVGALIASSLGALGMDRLRSSRKIYGESILALFLSGSLALALILFSFAKGINAGIFSYLFGSITTVSFSDLIIILTFGVVVFTLTGLLFKKFFLVSYDEELAKANGLNVNFLNGLLMLLAAVTVALSMQVVGVLLVGALMVIPVLAASQFGKSFTRTLLISILISLMSSVAGLISSFYLNLPSGAAIVVVALIFFGISLLANSNK
jgi:zinc transport system permease protein